MDGKLRSLGPALLRLTAFMCKSTYSSLSSFISASWCAAFNCCILSIEDFYESNFSNSRLVLFNTSSDMFDK